MISAVADTHAVIWYLAADDRLSKTAREFIDQTASAGDTIGLSSITLVEMVYLVEKGRIPPQAFSQLAEELGKSNRLFTEIPVDLKIARALTHVEVRQVPDMPDRIVAATAVYHQVSVISRDGKITLSTIKTIW